MLEKGDGRVQDFDMTFESANGSGAFPGVIEVDVRAGHDDE